MKEYDVIVIGSGGGAAIASSAFELGYTSALVEESKLGGTCLNRGCIPSKMLIHPANVATTIKEAARFNIKAGFSSANLSKLLQRINKITDTDSKGIKSWYEQKKKGLGYYPHQARFVADKIIEVNSEKITAKRIFIATGARPSLPPIPGLERTPFMTSTEALRARKMPKKLIVIGGGYIACELGYAYAALGSNVQWIVRDKALLTREDGDISAEFTEVFSKQHQVHFNTNTEKVIYKNQEFVLYLKDEKGRRSTITGDALLVATGVKPNSDRLGLENTAVKTDRKGFIQVNRYLETGVKGVYALGDVVGNYMFRHSVNFEASFLFETLFVAKKRKPIPYPPMPHAVFTHPEIGSVGFTESELREKKIPFVVGFSKYRESAMGLARLSNYGFVKLLFHQKTGKLLGAHILGEEASTMIHQLIYAITFGATADDLLNMIYIHPALPEIVRNAARNAQRKFT